MPRTARSKGARSPSSPRAAGAGSARLRSSTSACAEDLRHAVHRRAAATPTRRRSRRLLADPDSHVSLSRRRRASHLLLRCGLRPAPARPLGARPRRPRPRRGGAQADRPAGRALRHRGRGRLGAGLCRRPDAVRSGDGRARREAPRARPAGRRRAADRAGASACTASGSTACASPTATGMRCDAGPPAGCCAISPRERCEGIGIVICSSCRATAGASSGTSPVA